MIRETSLVNPEFLGFLVIVFKIKCNNSFYVEDDYDANVKNLSKTTR